MTNTLTMYENLQFEPIKIAPYSIVEVYKSSLDSVNCLGYFIQPVVDNMAQTIEERVRKVAAQEGFDSLAILAGNKGQYFNYRRVYAVWYNSADGAPSYPAEPEVMPLDPAAPAFNPYSEFTIDNEGVDCACAIEVAIAATGDNMIDLYLNDNHMTVFVNEVLREDNNFIVIDKTGVKLNDKKISTFDIDTIPLLKSGSNCLKIKNLNVTKVKVTYINQY